MTIKCLITDLDGTLVDTKLLNYHAFRLAFNDIDFDLNEKQFDQAFGHDFNSFVSKIIPHISDELKQTLRDKKNIYFDQFIDKAILNASLLNFLQLNKPNMFVALATSASRVSAEKLIKYFNMSNLFNMTICSDETKKCKPDPECFNRIMNSAGVSPRETLIFEDSKIGITAAIKSKANVIKIENWMITV